MDSATLVVVVLILLLQIITLAVILGDRKKRASQPQPALRDEDRTRDRREYRDRFPRKPGQQPASQWEQKNRRPSETPSQQQPQAPQAAPIDKSLRDINLRLKTAERDQDKARREIRGPSSDSSGMRGGRDRYRNGGGGRGDRDRRDRRDGGREGRDRDTRQRPSFNREETIAQQPSPAPVAAETDQTQIHDRNRPVRPVMPPVETPEITPEPAQVSAQTSEESESIEHGRKMVVKRRVLRGEEEGAGEQSATTQPAEATPEYTQESSGQAAQEEPRQETVYGRR